MNETIKFSELDPIETADDEQYIHVFDTLNNYKIKVVDFKPIPLDNIEDTTEGVKVTGQVQANALIGRATNSNASGVYTIDFNNLSENYNLVLTDNTSIGFANMISEDETVVFTLVVEGDFNFSVTGLDLDLDGDIYNTAGRNLIVIHIEKGGANFRGTYTIKNI